MTTMTEARLAWDFPAPDQGAYAGPATAMQVGALHREFARLGLHPVRDREERLGLAADLLGLDGLGSFRELTLGKAGWLLWHIGRCGSRAELEEAARWQVQPERDPGEDDGPPATCSLAGIISVIVAELLRADRPGRSGGLASRCWPLAGGRDQGRGGAIPETPDALRGSEPRSPGERHGDRSLSCVPGRESTSC